MRDEELLLESSGAVLEVAEGLPLVMDPPAVAVAPFMNAVFVIVDPVMVAGNKVSKIVELSLPSGPSTCISSIVACGYSVTTYVFPSITTVSVPPGVRVLPWITYVAPLLMAVKVSSPMVKIGAAVCIIPYAPAMCDVVVVPA